MTEPLADRGGEALAHVLASVRHDMEQRSRPFLDAAALRDQRDEFRRRVEIADAFVADQDCECRTPNDQCRWHYLGQILAGDL